MGSLEQTRATSGRPNWLVAQITCFSSQLCPALFADLVRSAAHWCIDPRLLAGARPVTTEEEELCPCVLCTSCVNVPCAAAVCRNHRLKFGSPVWTDVPALDPVLLSTSCVPITGTSLGPRALTSRCSPVLVCTVSLLTTCEHDEY